MSSGSWEDEAPCAGDSRFTLDEDSASDLSMPEARKLLMVCQECPFRASCIARVLPKKSRFDGVCGGRLWINGRIRAQCPAARPDELDERDSYIPHGTEAGARAHNRRGERACEFCRWAGRVAQAQRRTRRKTSPSK